MKPRIVFVNADLHKGFGDWVMVLPAVKLARDTWGSYAEVISICPAPLLELVEFSGVVDKAYPFRFDWCEYYGDLLSHALAVCALMDSDMFVYEDALNRTERYQITNRFFRNLYWKMEQHHALMIARNLAPLLGFDPQEPLAHPFTRWRMGDTIPRLVAVHTGHGTKWPRGLKNWPWFPGLIDQLQRAGYRVVQIIGPDDVMIHAPGAEFFKGTHLELAKFLLQCQLFIGNDSGPAHLAGALGVPTHEIFGSTNPALWHACGPRVTWTQAVSEKPEDVSVGEILSVALGKLAAYQQVA